LRSLFRSRRRRALPATDQGFGLPASPTGSLRYGENRISRVPVRSSRCMPCSYQTPVGPEHQAVRRSRCCLPRVTRRRLPRLANFGAQSHGLHLRCLRFATAVTRAPRKTRFRAVASLTRAGLDPQDLFGRFPKRRLISCHLFPLPRALLGARHPSQCSNWLLLNLVTRRGRTMRRVAPRTSKQETRKGTSETEADTGQQLHAMFHP